MISLQHFNLPCLGWHARSSYACDGETRLENIPVNPGKRTFFFSPSQSTPPCSNHAEKQVPQPATGMLVLSNHSPAGEGTTSRTRLTDTGTASMQLARLQLQGRKHASASRALGPFGSANRKCPRISWFFRAATQKGSHRLPPQCVPRLKHAAPVNPAYSLFLN